MLSKRCALSLNWVIRSSSPIGVSVLSSHCSSLCSATCDCTNRTAAIGVDARGQEPDRHVAGPLGERRAVVLAGDGMQVHDAVDAVVALLQRDPVLHRAKPVADVQLAGRLDPREYAWHGPNLPGSMEGSKTVSALDLLHLARTAAEAAAGYLRGGRAAAGPGCLDPQGQPGLRHRGGSHRGADDLRRPGGARSRGAASWARS